VIIDLFRFSHGEDSTLGILNINGDFECFTCEDEFRLEKKAGETRIPSGTYEIKGRNDGGMIKRYRDKFGAIRHPVMLWLQDVPNFKYVYIHVGNTHKDTEGCILVGKDAKKGLAGGSIVRSNDGYIELYGKVLKALGMGEKVEICIHDHLGVSYGD